jgi:hypothetical protein
MNPDLNNTDPLEYSYDDQSGHAHYDKLLATITYFSTQEKAEDHSNTFGSGNKFFSPESYTNPKILLENYNPVASDSKTLEIHEPNARPLNRELTSEFKVESLNPESSKTLSEEGFPQSSSQNSLSNFYLNTKYPNPSSNSQKTDYFSAINPPSSHSPNWLGYYRTDDPQTPPQKNAHKNPSQQNSTQQNFMEEKSFDSPSPSPSPHTQHRPYLPTPPTPPYTILKTKTPQIPSKPDNSLQFRSEKPSNSEPIKGYPKYLGVFTSQSLETIQEKSSVLSNLVRDKNMGPKDPMLTLGRASGGLDGEEVPMGSMIRISGVMVGSGRDGDGDGDGDGQVLQKNNRKHYSLLYDREKNQDVEEPGA